MLSGVRDHLRQDVSKVEDPRAEALFETTAEVLGGLITACLAGCNLEPLDVQSRE